MRPALPAWLLALSLSLAVTGCSGGDEEGEPVSASYRLRACGGLVLENWPAEPTREVTWRLPDEGADRVVEVEPLPGSGATDDQTVIPTCVTRDGVDYTWFEVNDASSTAGTEAGAFDADGRLLWHRRIPGSAHLRDGVPVWSPPGAPGATRVLDPVTGRVADTGLRRRELGDAAFTPDAASALVPTRDGWQLVTGGRRLPVDLPHLTGSRPQLQTSSQGLVVLVRTRLALVDPATGKLLWEVPPGSGGTGGSEADEREDGYVLGGSGLQVDDGAGVVWVIGDGRYAARDLATGEPLADSSGVADLAGHRWDPRDVGQGRLLLVSTGAGQLLIDADGGADEVEEPAIVALRDDDVLVLDGDGVLTRELDDLL